jgi:hypothetical protein
VGSELIVDIVCLAVFKSWSGIFASPLGRWMGSAESIELPLLVDLRFRREPLKSGLNHRLIFLKIQPSKSSDDLAVDQQSRYLSGQDPPERAPVTTIDGNGWAANSRTIEIKRGETRGVKIDAARRGDFTVQMTINAAGNDQTPRFSLTSQRNAT